MVDAKIIADERVESIPALEARLAENKALLELAMANMALIEDGYVEEMNDDAVADEEIDLERAQRKISMASDMEAAMTDTAWLASHPTPWTWKLAFHDGWFFRFFDANGTPCLGDDLREAGDAALLLTMVNR